ncbi:hypothetical protein EOI86_07145 [Hwanghaeella grinnelliae]|uniref:Uncharacterized protein n=1 Tax=Hwanghaeella grinnelliae TaxID=2500179 RepID=A0A437QX72_9PROT|nr:hypothetical protein [Hwanghaeella grinnelliae]RVU39026.1 hypothetical protein EOI86_07145 [Hwanghaeella grinnelliae]
MSLMRRRPFVGAGGGGGNLTENITVLAAADSTFAGVGAGDGTGINPEMTGARPFSPPVQMGNRLLARGIAAQAETVCQENGNGAVTTWNEYRSDIVSTGGFASSSRNPTIGGFVPRMTSSSQSITFTPGTNVDTLRFGNIRASAFGKLGVKVDGGVAIEYDQNAGSNGYEIEVIDGLSLGAHDFEFTQISGSAHGPGFIHAYNSTVPAFQIFNAGVRNTTIQYWLGTTYPSSTLAALDVLTPHVVILKHFINNTRSGGAGTSYEDMKTHYKTIFEKCGTIGARVLLVIPHDISGYGAGWDSATAVTFFEDLLANEIPTYTGIPAAAIVNVPQLLFEAGLSGTTEPATYTVLDTNGYMHDGLHAKRAVQAVEGAGMGDALITMFGLTAATAVPTYSVTDLTFSVAAATAAGATPQGNGDQDTGTFSADADFATIDGGTDADHWQIVDGYKLSPSAAGDAANLSGGSGGTYTLTVTYVKDCVPQRVTVTINT